MLSGEVHNKQLGMLVGVHVGDCLGIPMEFKPSKDIKEKWITEIVGGGSFNFPPGVGSDDTDLMLCILRSISKNKKVELYDIAKNFVMWKSTNPPDIGNTTRFGIQNIEKGEMLENCGLDDENSQGNGSIMRCAPLALLPDITYEDIKSQSTLTHAHINCIETDIFFINLLKQELEGREKQLFINDWFSNKEVREYLINCHRQEWESLPTSGWCVHSLGAALWSLHNTNSFEEGLISIVNKGDDADTTGAVTGALLGAHYGYDSIPLRWKSKLKSLDEIVKLLEKFNEA